MKLADKPCYPFSRYVDDFTKPETNDGLTFRERLIIALASNSAIFSHPDGTPNTHEEKSTLSNSCYIINQADAIIKQLKSELKK